MIVAHNVVVGAAPSAAAGDSESAAVAPVPSSLHTRFAGDSTLALSRVVADSEGAAAAPAAAAAPTGWSCEGRQ